MPYTRRTFVRTLFVASQASLVGHLFAKDLPNFGHNPGALNFVVLGDWGRHGRPDQREVAHQMGLTAQAIGARFVIAVGDNFYEVGVASVDDPHWEQSFEQVYTTPSLQVPWHVILGNHDYVGNCNAQLEYARTHPRWGMPARYYTQSHPLDAATSADFFYIDTSPMMDQYRREENHSPIHAHVMAEDVPAQLRWFEEALAKSRAPWKIVFGHHPVYSGGIHGDSPELIAQLVPLMQKHKVQAYICGHDHDLQHLQAGGIEYFVSGGGSEHRVNHPTPQMRYGISASGFAAVSLSPREMQVQLIDNTGKVLHAAVVSRAA